MKRFLLVVAMVALMVGAAQAGSFSITPEHPGDSSVPLLPGDTISYTVYFNNDVTDELWVAGYELMVAFDDTELAYLAPSPGHPGFGKIVGSFLGATPDAGVPGQVRVWALLGSGAEATGSGALEMFTLDFAVIASIPDFIPDVELLAQFEEDSYGIAAYNAAFTEIITYKFNGAQGADVGVPEPTTMALLGIGLLGTLLRKRS